MRYSSCCNFSQTGRRPIKVYIFEEISASSFQKYIVLWVYDVCGQSCGSKKGAEFMTRFPKNRALIKKNCYITVSKNDGRVSEIRYTPGLKYEVKLPSLHSCRFFQGGHRPIKLYIFGKLSMSTFQKYIVLGVNDICGRSYGCLKCIKIK